jgi:two-component system, cell cycle sensor histidine kinase and response regulator CckA
MEDSGPPHRAPPSVLPDGRSSAAGPTAAPPPPRRRVLLVDDDPPVAHAISRMLEALGYEVTACGDGAGALARFRGDPDGFDVVLTDQTLPGLRGDELTVALLALRPGLPVVLCTGFSERVDEERARELGARALLLKPFDLRELGAAVGAALAR